MSKAETKAPKKMALDDESRVKVLSPGKLVVKRFFRNRLAIVGLVIIVCMFLFSFVGGLITPYAESQTFHTTEIRSKNYASATINTNLYYTNADGMNFGSTAQAAFVLALQKNEPHFESGGNSYSWIQEGEDFYRIQTTSLVASGMTRGKTVMLSAADGVELTSAQEKAIKDAISGGKDSFELDGATYIVDASGKVTNVYVAQDAAICSKNIFNLYAAGAEPTYEFKYLSQKAIADGKSSFEVDGASYTIQKDEVGAMDILNADGSQYVSVSNLIVTPASTDVFLTVEFKELVQAAIDEGKLTSTFDYEDPATGEVMTCTVERNDFQYYIRTEQETHVIDLYAVPSAEHWLGTDGNGMDILTRLMYGGRVSLLIGIIVVLIEMVIGIVIGGVAGYFGKWVDQVLMRFVDIIICIPSMPLYIILGSMMDTLRVDSSTRIYYLVLIFGLLGWTGIARMVRGQILSLRVQEFMTAAEATGLSVNRRIFKHLIPNVVPQLIVFGTMDLGSIILSEATLSFLGLGVKFPYASWGNIVNAVNDSFVLTNYLFVWIPAGFLILITVLGYNFVGDGLRDAFDPKMKR